MKAIYEVPKVQRKARKGIIVLFTIGGFIWASIAVLFFLPVIPRADNMLRVQTKKMTTVNEIRHNGTGSTGAARKENSVPKETNSRRRKPEKDRSRATGTDSSSQPDIRMVQHSVP